MISNKRRLFKISKKTDKVPIKNDEDKRRENGKKEAFIISSRWPVIERWAVVGCGVCIIDWGVVCY